MARGIFLQLEDEVTTLDFMKVERAKLDGHRERVVVDEQGREGSQDAAPAAAPAEAEPRMPRRKKDADDAPRA